MPETVFTRVFYAASQVLQEALGDPQPDWDELLSRIAAKIGLDPVPLIDNPALDEAADPDPEC